MTEGLEQGNDRGDPLPHDRSDDDTLTWVRLREAATEAMEKAYAPYSGYPVGAAGLTTTGKVISGCNVENASYGLTQCAESGLISQLVLAQAGRLVAVHCVNSAGETITPCGRCRQLLFEFRSEQFLIMTPQGPHTIHDMLPQAFGPETLNPAHPETR